MDSVRMRTCRICSIAGTTDENLIDGSVFHRRCYDNLKEIADNLSHTQAVLLAELQKPISVGVQIAMFFSKSRRADVLSQKQFLAVQVKETRKKIQSTKATLTQVHDVWPGYPPDWDQRRELVRVRDNFCCAECGVNDTLQLHHRRAIREGGTHRLDNFVFLCAVCHSEAHGGKELKYKGPHSVDDNSPNAIERKIALINKAIAENKDVYFRYKNQMELSLTAGSARQSYASLPFLSFSP